MRTLGPEGRRAWIDTLSTYLRGAEYLVYHEGELIDICDEDGLEPATRIRAAATDEKRHGELIGFVHDDMICVPFGQGYRSDDCDLCSNTPVTEVYRRGGLQLCDPRSEEQQWW